MRKRRNRLRLSVMLQFRRALPCGPSPIRALRMGQVTYENMAGEINIHKPVILGYHPGAFDS